MNGQPDARRLPAGEDNPVALVRRDEHGVSRIQGQEPAAFILQGRLPLRQQHPLIARLVIPLACGRHLAGGDDPLNQQPRGLDQRLKQLLRRQRMREGPEVIHDSYRRIRRHRNPTR